jgi:hypothetical protein
MTYSNRKLWIASFKRSVNLPMVLLNGFVALFLLIQFITRFEDAAGMNAQGTFTYYLLPDLDTMYRVEGLHYCMLFIQACVTATMTFVFTSKSKQLTDYLSLPIRRSGFFCARFVSGLAFVCVPHVVFYVLMLLSNILILGFNPVMLQGFVLLLSITLTLLLLIYSASCAILLFVGSFFEKLLIPLAFLAALTELPQHLARYFLTFVHGNAAGEVDIFRPIHNPFLELVRVYTPPQSLGVLLKRYGQHSNTVSLGFNVPFWGDETSVGWGMVVILALLAVLLAFFALKRFVLYKAEIAGVRGISPLITDTITAVFTFIVSMNVFSTINIATMREDFSRITYIIAMLITSFIILFLLRVMIFRSIKKAASRSGLHVYALYGTATVLIPAVILITGGLGISSRLPDIADIEYAEISYPGAPDFDVGEGDYYSPLFHYHNDFSSGIRAQTGNWLFSSTQSCIRDYVDLKFRTERDLRIVQGIHQKLIRSGLNLLRLSPKQTANGPEDSSAYPSLRVHVRYCLKNGEIIDRLHKSVPVNVANAMLELDNTDAIRDRLWQNADLMERREHTGSSQIYITDATFRHRYEWPVEREAELLEALRADMHGLSRDEKYFPKFVPHAIITMPRLVEVNGQVGQPKYIYINEAEFFNTTFAKHEGIMEAATFKPPTGMPDKRVTLENNGAEMIQANLGLNGETVNVMSYGNVSYAQHTNTLQFYITEGYERTLALLDEYKLPRLNETDDILAMSAQRFQIHTQPQAITVQLYFRSNLIEYPSLLKESAAIPKDAYGSLLAVARSNYYASGGGYRLYIDVNDTESGNIRRLDLFIPEGDAPAFLKEAEFNSDN